MERAINDDGRSLDFFNPELLGGFAAAYRDTGERLPTPRDQQECLIEGVRCLAREAHFGGIVVQPVKYQVCQ